MKILITNDDGIQAKGLNALRDALNAVPGTQIAVIAPDSNRSASARSITTRQPLSVEEIEFSDGTVGYATDGTPVDCVRFAILGLIDFEPELIVSGINHGANLGDDVTYSGTVAAALEGVVLGIPSIAVSQQISPQGFDYKPGRGLDFTASANFTAGLVGRLMGQADFPAGTLININVPNTGDRLPAGVEITRLGKRIYRDKLEVVDHEDRGRRRYQIYSDDATYEPQDGSDFDAVAKGHVSVTPLHFDLTDHEGMGLLEEWGLGSLLKGGG